MLSYMGSVKMHSFSFTYLLSPINSNCHMGTEYSIYIGWLLKCHSIRPVICAKIFFLILSPEYYSLILSSVIMFLFCFITVSSVTVCLKGSWRINFQTLSICLWVTVIFHIPWAVTFIVPFLEGSMAASAAFEAQPCVSLIFCNTAWKMGMSSWMTANELSVQ